MYPSFKVITKLGREIQISYVRTLIYNNAYLNLIVFLTEWDSSPVQQFVFVQCPVHERPH